MSRNGSSPQPDRNGGGHAMAPAAMVCAVLAVLTLAVFWQTRRHEFVSYDDRAYVIDNPHVNAGLTWAGAAWAFTRYGEANWHPLTWLSHALDCSLYGLSPAGHHLTNVWLHAANAVLLFLVLWRMTASLWPSAFVAAVFAIHPLRVESVAWVAERKDVLCGFFWILTLGAYAFFAQRPASIRRYLLVALGLALALMAKPMAVTLPFVLLLLDFWPLRRFDPFGGHTAKLRESGAPAARFPPARASRLVIEKTPLFALVAASCVVTYVVQAGGGAVQEFKQLPLDFRVANAVTSYLAYIGKTLWPTSLAVLYPYSTSALPLWKVLGAALVLAAATVAILASSRKQPYLLTGWLWYLGTLVPVIGVVQVGAQSMADRYTYLPGIGLSIMAAWGLPTLAPQRPIWRHAVAAIAVASILGLACAAWVQTRYWRNGISLFSHAADVTADNYIAHFNLGLLLEDKGKSQEAIGHYRKAIAARSDAPAAHLRLGAALLREGKSNEAIAQYKEALQANPNLPEALCDLGVELGKQGKYAEAVQQFQKALSINPNNAISHKNLGYVFEIEGKTTDSIAQYEEAVRCDTDFGDAHYALGLALAKRGELGKAVYHFNETLRLSPQAAEAHNSLAIALKRMGRIAEAIQHYETALKINPNYAIAHNNLALALREEGKTQEAIERFQEAVKLDPDYLAAHFALASALDERGERAEAMRHYFEALRIEPDLPEAHEAAAAILESQGKWDEAMAHYQAVIKNHPEMASAQFGLGKALVKQGRIQEAQEALRAALSRAEAAHDTTMTAQIRRELGPQSGQPNRSPGPGL